MGSSHRKRGLEFLLVGGAFVSPHMPSSCIFLNNEMFLCASFYGEYMENKPCTSHVAVII